MREASRPRGSPLLDKKNIPVVSRILQDPAGTVVHNTHVPRCTVNAGITSGLWALGIGEPHGPWQRMKALPDIWQRDALAPEG